MKAFHNDPDLKLSCIGDVDWHIDQDRLIQSVYWNGEAGCFVGCLVHSEDHSELSEKYGWPEWLCYLCDHLHEGLPLEKTKHYFKAIPSAIPVGFENWNALQSEMLIFMLERLKPWLENEPSMNEVVNGIIGLHKRRQSVTLDEWCKAADFPRPLSDKSRFAFDVALNAATPHSPYSVSNAAIYATDSGEFEQEKWEVIGDKLIELLKQENNE